MTNRYRQLSWLLLIPLALILTACGGDDNDAIDVGAAAPDFSLTAATGETISLADYQGQPVLLYFHMAVG